MKETEQPIEEMNISAMEDIDEIDISQLQGIDSKTVDLDKYDGERAKIAGMKPVRVPSKFTKSGKADALRIFTEPVGDVKMKNGEPLRASMLYNLKKEEGGTIGWSKQGKLEELLAKKGVKYPTELVGKNVVLTVRVKNTPGSKFPRKFLGFN